MAGKIYSGTYTTTILLTNTAQNPVTLTGSISVHGTNASSDSGFYSNANFAWTINNMGRIAATGATSYGIALLQGGTIVNGSVGGGAAGFIQADEIGIFLTGAAGRLTNDGTVIGTLGRGVFLEDGGTVTNGASGATSALIQGGFEGVAVYNANAMVSNLGTILATGTSGFGVEIYAGTVSNLAGGQIGGTYGVGFVAKSTLGTLSNAGTITGRGRDGVAFTDGGTVTNSGTINGAIAGVLSLGTMSTVTNSGSIGGAYAGVDLLAGGTATNHGLITGGFGVSSGNARTVGPVGVVVNSGTITGSTYEGVSLAVGGSVSNTGGIYGKAAGVASFYAAASVTNMGSIGSASVGVDLLAGGSLTNTASGGIYGKYGIILGSSPSGVANPASMFSNAGTIVGSGTAGAEFLTNGQFVNQAGGLIQGGKYGAYIESVTGTIANYGTITGTVGVYGREVVANGHQYPGQFTVLNAGTITGNGGTAVSLFSSNDLLIDEAGSVFNGTVNGGGGRLELAAGMGAVGSLAPGLASFSTVTVDSGGTWALTGALSASSTLVDRGVLTVSATTVLARGAIIGVGTVAIGRGGVLQAGGTIGAATTLAFTDTAARLTLVQPLLDSGTQAGFKAGDVINLIDTLPDGLSESYSGTASSGTLTLEQNGSQVGNLAFSGSYTTGSFAIVTDRNGGADVIIPCFLAGSLIATPAGAMRVERLRAGMTVLTAGGAVRPVVWVGRRVVDVARHADPDSVRPVRIARGAFGAGRPERDLLLSPDHAVLHDRVLIPVHLLVNGTSVRREGVAVARYHHVELDAHDILLAEGLAVESYLDCGNRALLGEAAGRRGPSVACAPIVLGGAAVARARRHLLARSRRRVAEAPVRLLADGRAVVAARRMGRRVMFLVPARAVRLDVELDAGHALGAALLDGVLLAAGAFGGGLDLPAGRGTRCVELVVSGLAAGRLVA